MKKSELIKLLNSINGDPEVIMSKDSEGNRFLPLVDYSYPMKYVAGSTYAGEVYSLDEEEANLDQSIDAVVLWPAN